MMSLLSVLAALVLIVFSYLLYKWFAMVRRFSHIPTPKHLYPVFGHLLRFPKDEGSNMFDFFEEMFVETKSKFQVFWMSILPIVAVFDRKMIETLLKSNFYLSKGPMYSWLNDWLGTGLVTSDGEKWKSRRRLLTPAFHFGILKFNAVSINQHATHLVNHLKEKIKIESKHDVQEMFKLVSLGVICETAMGVHVNLQINDKNTSKEAEYCKSVDEILHLFASRISKPWLYNDFIYRYLSQEGKKYYRVVNSANLYVRSVIESRIKLLEEKPCSESSIFLDILIGAYRKNEIDINGIIEEVNTFMFAGHDTVSSALAWILYLLGKNKNVQEKLYSEIKDLDGNLLDRDVISELKYLECVIKEGLRLFPPAPSVSRHFKKDGLLENLKIPGGSSVGMFFYLLHRDKDIWESPHEFLPDRFLDCDSEKNPYSYLPFSAGPRNCIGQRFALLELKITLFHLVKSFVFESIQEEKDMGIHSVIVLRSKKGIWLEITER